MKLAIEDMLSAAALLSECKETKGIESSRAIWVIKEPEKISFRLASGVEICAEVPIENDDEETWETFIDRGGFIQFWKACKGMDGTATLIRSKGALQAKAGKRRVKFPEEKAKSGYGSDQLPPDHRITLSEEAVLGIGLAAHYAGGDLNPELQTIFLAGDEILSSNSLEACRVPLSSKKALIPIPFAKLLSANSEFHFGKQGSRLHYEVGDIFYPHDLSVLRQFPTTKLLHAFKFLRKLKPKLILGPVSDLSAMLGRLQAFISKAGAEEFYLMRIIRDPRKKLLHLGAQVQAGEYWEELPAKLKDSLDVEILISPLIPFLSAAEPDDEIKITWEDENSPFHISSPSGNELLLTRKIKLGV